MARERRPTREGRSGTDPVTVARRIALGTVATRWEGLHLRTARPLHPERDGQTDDMFRSSILAGQSAASSGSWVMCIAQGDARAARTRSTGGHHGP
ncbi:hypothetical protein GCM10028787_00260 [Brachybacterium horti]